MSSSSVVMPPPPSPLAHRRTRPSHPHPDSPPCLPRKMSLSKAATFHQPSSPANEDDPVLSVSHLAKRSTTYSRSAFASWLYDGREAAAEVLADFEQTFSGARGSRPSIRRRSVRDFEDNLLAKIQRPLSPVDSGIGSSIGSPSEKNLSRTLEKALDLTSNKDSALGSSIAESVSEDLIQDANSTKVTITTTSRTSRSPTAAPLTIIQYPFKTPNKNNPHPILPQKARRVIYQKLFQPLLAEQKFKEFHPVVASTRKNAKFRCLRDIERSLINQPVVSIIYPRDRTQANALNKTTSVTPSEFRAFGELTVQLVVDTYQHLSESEQRRASDRPYNNGYFLDLVQQVQQLAAHIGSSSAGVEEVSVPADFDEEVTLEGGLSDTGNIAELVRWNKNGEGISLRTGLPYAPLPGMKRQASSEIDDMQRSMARRKKGYIPELIEMPCSQPDCDKTFTRKCDLSKHEKTHTRPYKCPDPKCRYHDMGLPTEKELDRHVNDRHNMAPKMYHCKFCEFKTKRESNCKQHMEKKHDWTYHRAKGKDKATTLTPGQTPDTPAHASSSMESPASASYWDESGSVASSMHQSPFQQSVNHTNTYAQNNGYPAPLFPRGEEEYDFNAPPTIHTNFGQGAYVSPYLTPSSAVQHKFTPQVPLYSPFTPSPMLMDDNGICADSIYYDAGLPTPESAIMHSRHDSNAYDTLAVQELSNDPMINAGMPMPDFVLLGGAFANSNGPEITLFEQNMDMQTEYTPEMFDNMPSFDENEFDAMIDFDEGKY